MNFEVLKVFFKTFKPRVFRSHFPALIFFHIFMGGCQCLVALADFAVQFPPKCVCYVMLIVLFQQNKMYACV